MVMIQKAIEDHQNKILAKNSWDSSWWENCKYY